jgi:hypothetical protein
MSALETFQIYLSSMSADRIYNNNNCDCEFNLPVIEIPSQYHIHISVQNAVIPFTFYNVNANNNVLCYYMNSTQYDVNITLGNYNVNTLKKFLNDNMPGFTITYNSITNKYTFTNNTATEFTILACSTCYYLIGFSQENVASVNGVLTSTRVINMAPVRLINVLSNLPTNNINKISSNNKSVICCIPVETQPFSIIHYVNTTGFKINSFTNTISTLQIKLTDQLGTLLDLNGSNWSMTLQVDIVDFVDDTN